MEITDIYFNSGSKDLTDEFLSNKIDSTVLKKISEKSGFTNRKILCENESHISILKKLIKDNDLIHADVHGAVSFNHELIDELLNAIKFVESKEKIILEIFQYVFILIRRYGLETLIIHIMSQCTMIIFGMMLITIIQ